MTSSEHILLESDEREIPNPRTSRRRHASIVLRSRLRRRSLDLELIDYYFLVVRQHRGQSFVAEYVLDLRFVAPSLQFVRRVAWRWGLATLVLGGLAVAVALRIDTSASPGEWLKACAAVSGMTLVASIVFSYRTIETVRLFSAHGRARLLEFTSGVGAIRALQPFAVKLAAHIRIAEEARRSLRSEHLRDEMREHFRLHQTGVLSTEEYENSKGRILAGHTSADALTRSVAAKRRRPVGLRADEV
jgi:hypothetical protein